MYYLEYEKKVDGVWLNKMTHLYEDLESVNMAELELSAEENVKNIRVIYQGGK